MPWTKQQQKVIDQRDADILVSAAAGSGKTAVLVERIIQKITDDKHPIDVDHLLVVTFTKAAAGEMKERIMAALDEKVREFPGNQHFVKQLSLIHKAQITTIHSFCMNLIRDYFYVLGIDPSTAPGDEGRLSAIRQEVLDDLLEEAYEKKEEDFINLIESYSPGKNDNIISEYILKLYQNARSHREPFKWLDQAEENISVETLEQFEQAPFMKIILRDARISIDGALNLIKEALELSLSSGGPYFYEKTFRKDLEIVTKISEAQTFSKLCEVFVKIEKPRLSGRKKKTDESDEMLQEQCKLLRAQAYGLLDDLKAAYFYENESEIFHELKRIKSPIRGLIHLTREFMMRYDEKKKNENIMDFDDMEHFALDLLIDHYDEQGNPVPSKIAKEKSDGYEEIYIDEYKDSNYIQDAILRSVSKEAEGGHNMFMVGDVKQSIYSFRLARPELFLEKYHGYQQKGEEYQLIELRNNFRSRSEVLTFVNDVFYQIMHEDLGNIEYTKNVALVPTMEFEQGCDAQTEILLLESKEVKNSEEDAVVLEARMIASRIHEMVNGEKPMMVTGKDEEGNTILRKARYSDIVILLRSMKGNAEVIQKELMDAGIPAFANSQKGYFDTVEIRTLLSLLSVVDNIYLDIDLAAVLRSPMIGMSEEELGRLKVDGGKNSLYECLCETKESIKGSKKALQLLELLRDAKTYLSLTQLIWLALEKTGYYYYAGAMPQGKKRQGNILMLIEQAKTFESSQIKGLFHFVRFMEQCKEYDMDYGEANTMSEDQDLVRISSIHKSKGLEYPIVFVSKIHQKFNLRDANGSMIFHGDYFIGADHIDPIRRTKKKTILKNLIRNQMNQESLGEELRVLYVAMTRAKEKLILTGIKTDDIMWHDQEDVTAINLLNGRCYFDWIKKALPKVPKEDYRLKIYTLEDLLWQQEGNELLHEMNRQIFYERLKDQIPKDKVKEMKDKFDYHYRNETETKGRLKYSVSEIKRMSQAADKQERLYTSVHQEKEKRVPAFIKKNEKISATSKGTVIHKVLELLNFSKDHTMKSLNEDIKEWIDQGKLKKEYDKVIYRKEILALTNSQLGKRMKIADQKKRLYKERQFVTGIPFSDMNQEAKTDDFVVVQGIIDAYFEETDGIVLVDYKTDRVNEGEEHILINRYHAQMESYKQALEKITGKNVKEIYIYSVTLQKTITVHV